MWIKICGMTSPEAVAAALEARADAIGFVFAESARRLTPERAAQLAKPARDRVRCVAVTRHPTQSAVDEILEVFAPDVLQTDLTDLERLTLPAGLERLPVLRAGGEPPATVPRRVLFEGPRSGSGAVSDWNAARDLARRTQLVLAGGLNAGNVAAAIAAVRPFGVDVSSGVELEPGIKNPLEIAGFVRAARAASGAASADAGRLLADLIAGRFPDARGRFGPFGGRYVPETLMPALERLERGVREQLPTRGFKEELAGQLRSWVGRPTPLTFADRLSERWAARVWLKREDLAHTGAHKINNAMGQALLAKRLGAKRVVAETGAGQHGVASAAACARLGLPCTVYMGSIDMERQAPNVGRMRLLGAEVVPVTSGDRTP